MSLADRMRVIVREPTRTLYEGDASRLQAVAEDGAFGMLPNHADHLAALVPAVLVLTEPDGRELFFGVDHGLLVKRGHEVGIAVRRAVQGESLAALSETIARRFLAVDDAEKAARTALARLEVGIVRHFGELRKPVS